MDDVQSEEDFQHTESADEMYEELKVFKDCSIKEFEEIFGPDCNTDLPLYANLFKLREQLTYYNMAVSITNSNIMPFIIAANSMWYYI